MARIPLLAFSLASALLLAGLAVGQTGSGTTGSNDVHRASVTLSANCASLAKTNGTSGSGAGGNGTGGNGTSGAGGSLPLCMTPSRITAPSGARAVLLTFTNRGSADLCLDARAGAIRTTGDTTNGTGGANATGEDGESACEGMADDPDVATRTTACDAAGTTGAGAGGGTAANGTGNDTSEGELAMPTLVMAGDAAAVCIPLATTGVVTVLLADSGTAIGQISRSGATGGTPATTTPGGNVGTGAGANDTTNETGEESVGDGDNGVPGPGLVLLLAAAAFVAVAWPRKK